MTNEEIDWLLAPRKRRVSSKRYGWTADGEKVSLTGKGSSQRVGRMESKVGSTVRSRKGRTYKKANGYAFYNDVDADITAYVWKP